MARGITLENSMKLLLDFHYSHWLADSENQWIPLSWRKSEHEDKIWGSHWTQGELWMNSDENWEETENRSLFDRNAQALEGIDALVNL